MLFLPSSERLRMIPRFFSTRAVLHGFGNLAALSLLQCLMGGIVILFFGSVVTEAVAGPADPVLRLETGMHTAQFWRIDFVADNLFIV